MVVYTCPKLGLEKNIVMCAFSLKAEYTVEK